MDRFFVVSGQPDPWFRNNRQPRNLGGQSWLESTMPAWSHALQSGQHNIRFDMSEIGFVGLAEWVSTVAIMEAIMIRQPSTRIVIDLAGEAAPSLVAPADYIRFTKTNRHILPSEYPEPYRSSHRIYTVAGYLESLGTLSALNGPEHTGMVSYKDVDPSRTSLRRFYAIPEDYQTTLLGLHIINSADACRQFLDERRIYEWRSAMDARFRSSPLFENEELWRVLCHELAVNIWEHAKVSGFVSARVVNPVNKSGQPHPWCLSVYPRLVRELLPRMQEGFLELCVADGGPGFKATLEDAYLSQIETNSSSGVKAEHILEFAFDEIGTSKNELEGWTTERHALGRILQIVARYGGVLILGSSGVEVTYSRQDGMFDRCYKRPGYKSQGKRDLPSAWLGSHLRIILPLVPLVDMKHLSRKRTPLDAGLPRSFHTQTKYPRGHLVPLVEALSLPATCIPGDENPTISVGAAQQRQFREACKLLGSDLLRRHRDEPIVLDFGGLNWTAAQFETLLYILQNVLQQRSVLLVGLHPSLAREAIQLEHDSASTTLVPSSDSNTLPFNHIPEKTFMEAYSRIGATILGLDSDGKQYIFGLRDHNYEHILLGLINQPATVDEILARSTSGTSLEERIIRSLLHPANRLFKVTDGRWRTVWEPQQLEIEAKRTLAQHFDAVATRCHAWRGQIAEGAEEHESGCAADLPTLINDGGNEIRVFNLPWQEEWRTDFLECSRILARQRYADEAAQRLIYHLRRWLESNKRSLSDVKVLACVTAPAMLLAATMHKWWPIDHQPPTVADLGYYVMLGQSQDPPIISNAGEIVIVQDVLDTGRVSGRLVEMLRAQGMDVLCVIGLVRLVPGLKQAEAVPVGNWVELSSAAVPYHTVIEAPCPQRAEEPNVGADDSHAYWVEPRSLHPIPYPVLRQETQRTQLLKRRDDCLLRLAESADECLFAAGHYVYGQRHYPVVVDVRRLLGGEIGGELASWLADVCEGVERTWKADWETDEGYSLKGEVTAVLMPLHSQIHYLWPRVEAILAQRGRRQPMWFLQATLFTGGGPSYQLPDQLIHQIKMAVQESIAARGRGSHAHPNPLRILVVDDSIASGRTAETVITEIQREVDVAFSRAQVDPAGCPKPIAWIRYFAVLNQMGHARHSFWHYLTCKENTQTALVFEEFAPLMGVPLYDANDCPACSDRRRLERLIEMCKEYGADMAHRWLVKRLANLRPTAVDNPGFHGVPRVHLPNDIEVLASGPTNRNGLHVKNADTAIWLFYQLMHLSYPPGDVLRSLKHAWVSEGTLDPSVAKAMGAEYERYRWAVLEWCMKNWYRVVADTSRQRLVDCCMAEIRNDTDLVLPLLELAGLHYSDPHIASLVKKCIGELACLEKRRGEATNDGVASDRISRVTRLEAGLTLFFLSVPPDHRGDLGQPDFWDNSSQNGLLEHINTLATDLDPMGPSFTRNLHRRLTQPHRSFEPWWALSTIAENLFRGRGASRPKGGSHSLLPRLIMDITKDPSNGELRGLLSTTLALFLTAINEITLYTSALKDPLDASSIKEHAGLLLKWLQQPVNTGEEVILDPALWRLNDALEPSEQFCRQFNYVFHSDVSDIKRHLEEQAQSGNGLVFEFKDDRAQGCTVLTMIQRLEVCLHNLAIEPATSCTKSKSRIEAHHLQGPSRAGWIVFRLLTNFADLQITRNRTGGGRNAANDQHLLEMFGAEFSNEWMPASASERAEGFTTTFEIKVMAGFVPSGGVL